MVLRSSPSAILSEKTYQLFTILTHFSVSFVTFISLDFLEGGGEGGGGVKLKQALGVMGMMLHRSQFPYIIVQTTPPFQHLITSSLRQRFYFFLSLSLFLFLSLSIYRD